MEAFRNTIVAPADFEIDFGPEGPAARRPGGFQTTHFQTAVTYLEAAPFSPPNPSAVPTCVSGRSS